MRATRHYLSLLVVVTLVGLTLTGCIKLNVTITVNPDGSNTFGFAIGLTEQAKAFAGSEGIADPFGAIQEQIGQDTNTEAASVRHWSDGQYEWAEAVLSFKTLDELNTRMAETEIFESFDISKRSGLLKDSFIVNAKISPSGLDSELPSDMGFDPTGMFETRIKIALPGTIIETNGLREGSQDSNLLSWPLISEKTVQIHAVSERWNPTRLILISAAALLAVVAAVAFFLLVTTFVKRRPPAA